LLKGRAFGKQCLALSRNGIESAQERCDIWRRNFVETFLCGLLREPRGFESAEKSLDVSIDLRHVCRELVESRLDCSNLPIDIDVQGGSRSGDDFSTESAAFVLNRG
jgi:hypothetical protein